MAGLGFADGRRRAEGRQTLARHTPSLWNAGQQRWLGWDGAHDSLWSQALQPLLHPHEMASHPAHLRQLLASDPGLGCAVQALAPRAGLDDDDALLSTLAPMAHFVRDTGYPPESIDIVSGQPTGPGSSGFSAAMLPFLQAVGDTATLRAQVLRLQARPLRPDAYYEQALGLFGQGWLEGWYRFTPTGHVQPRWKPA